MPHIFWTHSTNSASTHHSKWTQLLTPHGMQCSFFFPSSYLPSALLFLSHLLKGPEMNSRPLNSLNSLVAPVAWTDTSFSKFHSQLKCTAYFNTQHQYIVLRYYPVLLSVYIFVFFYAFWKRGNPVISLIPCVLACYWTHSIRYLLSRILLTVWTVFTILSIMMDIFCFFRLSKIFQTRWMKLMLY